METVRRRLPRNRAEMHESDNPNPQNLVKAFPLQRMQGRYEKEKYLEGSALLTALVSTHATTVPER